MSYHTVKMNAINISDKSLVDAVGRKGQLFTLGGNTNDKMIEHLSLKFTVNIKKSETSFFIDCC